jgi:hypothetical protein
MFFIQILRAAKREASKFVFRRPKFLNGKKTAVCVGTVSVYFSEQSFPKQHAYRVEIKQNSETKARYYFTQSR